MKHVYRQPLWLKPGSRFCNTSSAQVKSCWVFKRGPPNSVTPIHVIYHKPKFSQLSCTLLVSIRLSHQLNMLLELCRDLPGCTLSVAVCFISSTVLDEIGCSVSAWLWCQLRRNLSAQLPLAYSFVSLIVTSADCSSGVTCHLSCSCHLLSNSSSQLQLNLSAQLHPLAQVWFLISATTFFARKTGHLQAYQLTRHFANAGGQHCHGECTLATTLRCPTHCMPALDICGL